MKTKFRDIGNTLDVKVFRGNEFFKAVSLAFSHRRWLSSAINESILHLLSIWSNKYSRSEKCNCKQ